MEEIDNISVTEPPTSEDEQLLMSEVICDDPELMYLHVCLGEILS